jgi:hypothetical protein
MLFGSFRTNGGVMQGVVFYYLVTDVLLAVFSLLCVWGYMWFTLRSFFLASLGMTHILFSIPVSFTAWTFFGSQYVGFLQLMGLFVILGIGADDIFIFYDAWKQVRGVRLHRRCCTGAAAPATAPVTAPVRGRACTGAAPALHR